MEIILSGGILLAAAIIIGGGLLLYFGAERFISGSSAIAIKLGMTPLIIGLTIVAFGTGSPELIVGVSAAIKGRPGIAIGNIIGANIANILLILGVSSLIKPIRCSLKVIKVDIVMMIVVTLFFCNLLIDGLITRADGIMLLVGVVAYYTFTITMSIKNKDKEQAGVYQKIISKTKGNLRIDLLFIIGGIGLLVIGAEIFLSGILKIADTFHVNDTLLGLSIVAVGTSLPELAASIVASIKNYGEISIGNAISSNIFNILGIIGIAALIKPIDTKGVDIFDIVVLACSSIIILPLAWTKQTLSRLEGAFLLMSYIAYFYYLITKY